MKGIFNREGIRGESKTKIQLERCSREKKERRRSDESERTERRERGGERIRKKEREKGRE